MMTRSALTNGISLELRAIVGFFMLSPKQMILSFEYLFFKLERKNRIMGYYKINEYECMFYL